MDAPTDVYQPTTEIPDDEGEALLDELNRLDELTHSTTDKNGKSRTIRSGSKEERRAEAALHKAIIDAALRFKRHEEFTTWLLRNHCEHIDAMDPIRGHDLQINKIRALEVEVERLKSIVDGHSKLLDTLGHDLLARVAAKQEKA
jgi:hypothetical protein